MLLHAEFCQYPRHEIESSRGNASAQDDDVVGVEVQPQGEPQRLHVVDHMVVRDAAEAAQSQLRDEAIGIRAPHLVRQDRFSRFDQLIARRHHDDRGLCCDAQPGPARRRGDGDLRRAQDRAGSEQAGALASIAAAPMHVLPRFDRDHLVEHRRITVSRDALDRHDGIAALRQHRPCHDLDAVRLVREDAGRIARALTALHMKAPQALAHRLRGERDAVHGHAVEGRLIALRVDVFLQQRAGALHERQCLARECTHMGPDHPIGFVRSQQGHP